MAMNPNEARLVFERANAVITQVQSPASRPRSQAVELSDGRYTVRVYSNDSLPTATDLAAPTVPQEDQAVNCG